MNISLNPYRIIQLLVCAISYFGMSMNNFDYDSTMLFVNLSLVTNLLLIWKNSTLISTKMILSFLIYSVAIVPGVAYYLLGFKLYSYVNFDHQLNDVVSIYTLWLFYVSSNFYSYFVLEKDTPLPDIKQPIKNETRMPFIFMCLCILFFGYFSDSGPTLISTGYEEIIESRTSALMTLSGVALAAFLGNAFGKMRVFLGKGEKIKVSIFWALALAVIVWLVLHARRTEAIGIISIILIQQRIQTGKTPYKYFFIALASLFLLYFVGYIRVSAITDLNILETIMESLKPSFEGGSGQKEFANMPSGLGNITASMQTSVYHFNYLGNDFLNGYTMYVYPIKLLPTNLTIALGLADPETYFYNDLVLDKYYYNGGTYLYAPAYGNFGLWGMIFASALMGMLVNWTQKSIRSTDYIRIVLAFIIIFSFIKICWYNFLPMVKSIVYNLIILFYVAMIFKEKKSPKSTLDQSNLKTA